MPTGFLWWRQQKVHLFAQAREGDILLDSLNDVNLQDLSVFGICDKQLACHSCRVNFKQGGQQLPEPGEDEQDVLCELGKLYREAETRMSCQIQVD